jgi:transposase
VTSAELSKTHITQAKRTIERGWLAEVSAVVLQQSLRDLDTAYKNFFDFLKGNRKGRKAAPPGYKSKKDTRQSIRAKDASQSAGKTRTKIPAQRVEAGSYPDGHKTVAGIPGLADRGARQPACPRFTQV